MDEISRRGRLILDETRLLRAEGFSMVDTRRTLRYPIDLPGRIRLGRTELYCRIRNLSLGGVCVVGPALPVDTRVNLRFSAPHVEAFSGMCVTRWTAQEMCGLQFEGLRAIDTYQLARFIRSASRATLRLPAITIPPAR
jgi:hypothetical protein